MIVLAFLVYIVKLLAGFFLLHLLWGAREPKALTFKFFLGAGMGAGLSSLLFFLWSWLTIPDRFYPIFELLIFILLAVLFWRKLSKDGLPALTLPSKRTVLGLGLLLVAVLVCTANFFIISRTAPHGIYDAWDIWNIGARFVYFSPNQWVSVISQNAWDHADYPLLVTLNVADAWAILGSNTTQAPAAFSLFFMLSLVGLLFSALWMLRDVGQGVVAAIILLSLAELVNIAMFQYADIQLAYAFLATAALIHLYTVQPNPRFVFLAGLFAGFSAWTKNEGGAFVAISFLLCCMASFRTKRHILFFAAGLLFPMIVILLFKSVSPPNDLFVDRARSLQQLFDFSRYQLIFAQLWQNVGIFGGWQINLFLVLVLYSIAVWKVKMVSPLGQPWILFGFFVLQFAGYFVIYLITPHDLYWHLDTSLNRLMFHVFPILLFGLFTLLPSPQQLFNSISAQAESREPYVAHD